MPSSLHEGTASGGPQVSGGSDGHRTYEYQSDFVRKFVLQGRVEGKAEGEAEAVLTVLDTRGFDVPSDVRARITSCSDLDQLSRWLRLAVTVRKVQDLFDQ
jgi:hypothetical protein